MTARVRHLPGDVLGLDAFARAVLANRPRPAPFAGLVVPARAAECEMPQRDDDPALLDRVDLAERLRAHVEPGELHPAVDESIGKLTDERGLAVVASVRPAFLGGPLATLYAAVHAASLARELERAWQRPVAPVLWLRSDEHDLVEVRSVQLLTEHHDLARTGLSAMGSGRRPIASLPVSEAQHRLGALREHLRQVLRATPQRDRAIALFAPKEGETLGERARRAYGSLLGHLGLVCVEPFALRGTLSRALARLVAHGDAAHFQAARARLAGLCEFDEQALLFRHDDGQRTPLHVTDSGFLFEGELGERSGNELAAEIVAQPELFTSGALLEPIARDFVLPVAATVGGFGAARDIAAGLEWRRACGAPEPLFVPRVHATLVGPLVRESLQRCGLELEDVLRARCALAEVETPTDRPPVLDDLRRTIARHALELRDLGADLAEVDRGLAHHLRRGANENADRIAKILERAERVHANRTGKSRRHLRRVANTVCPGGEPQESVLTLVQHASDLGSDWIDELAAAVDPFPSEHLVLELDAPSERL